MVARTMMVPVKRETDVVREVLAALAFSGRAIILEPHRARGQAGQRGMLEIARVNLEAAMVRGREVAVLWRQNTGAARLPGRGGREQLVRLGLPGQGDITGFLAPSGVRIEIEVKTESRSSKESPVQVAFGALAREAGAARFVVRSGRQAVDELEAWIASRKEKQG